MHGERAPRLVSDDAQNIMYDKAFRTTLASEISEPIFKDRSAFYITQLRDKCRVPHRKKIIRSLS